MQAKRILTLLCSVLLVGSLLGGCSLHKQAFHKEAHLDVKKLGLLEPANTGEYNVTNLGHVGTSFGLIGGLIATMDMRSKSGRFTEMMKARNFNIAEEFRDTLSVELQNAGYMVKLIKVSREKAVFLESYDDLDKDVDAYLDPGIGAGYMCASGEADYIPSVRSGVRLIKKASGEIIYQDLVAYGYELRRSDAISIAAEEKYFFHDFGELSNDPERALEGLKKGVPLVAKRIAQDLNR